MTDGDLRFREQTFLLLLATAVCDDYHEQADALRASAARVRGPGDARAQLQRWGIDTAAAKDRRELAGGEIGRQSGHISSQLRQDPTGEPVR